jgi:hypothetical protein
MLLSGICPPQMTRHFEMTNPGKWNNLTFFSFLCSTHQEQQEQKKNNYAAAYLKVMPLKLGVPEISAPQFHLSQALISGTPCSSVIRVQPPITEHVLITEHFPILTSFISRIEQFLFQWMCKLEG